MTMDTTEKSHVKTPYSMKDISNQASMKDISNQGQAIHTINSLEKRFSKELSKVIISEKETYNGTAMLQAKSLLFAMLRLERKFMLTEDFQDRLKQVKDIQETNDKQMKEEDKLRILLKLKKIHDACGKKLYINEERQSELLNELRNIKMMQRFDLPKDIDLTFIPEMERILKNIIPYEQREPRKTTVIKGIK
jgi:hypothetical protein